MDSARRDFLKIAAAVIPATAIFPRLMSAGEAPIASKGSTVILASGAIDPSVGYTRTADQRYGPAQSW